MEIISHDTPSQVIDLIDAIIAAPVNCPESAQQLREQAHCLQTQNILFGSHIHFAAHGILQNYLHSVPDMQLENARKLAEFNQQFFSQNHPQYSRILCLLAQIYLALGKDKLECAEKCLRCACSIDPFNPIPNTLYASYLFHNERSDEALPFYQNALAVEPNNYNNISALITCYTRKGDYRTALNLCLPHIPALEKAANENPNRQTIRNLVIFYNQAANAIFHLPEEDQDQVLAYADKINFCNPDEESIYWHRCRVYCRRGDLEKAALARKNHTRLCSSDGLRSILKAEYEKAIFAHITRKMQEAVKQTA